MARKVGLAPAIRATTIVGRSGGVSQTGQLGIGYNTDDQGVELDFVAGTPGHATADGVATVDETLDEGLVDDGHLLAAEGVSIRELAAT